MTKKVFPAELEKLDSVTAFVEEELEKVDCPIKVITALDVCVEEIFVNIAHYAYPGKSGSAEISVNADPADNSIVIQFVDEGIPFDPLKRTEPDVSLGADERSIGGLGIFMVRKMTDEMTYEYTNGRNVLTIRKRL